MIRVIGIHDNKVIDKEVTSKINALNLMSVLQGNGDSAFIIDTTFPSAYPCFIKAYDLIVEYRDGNDVCRGVEILEQLEDLEIKQGIRATKELLKY